MNETTTPTPPEVKIEFDSLYFKGPIKLEITRAEDGSFAIDRFTLGLNGWHQTAHENGFRSFPGSLARLARHVITFASGPVEISSLRASLLVDQELGRWHIIDQADGSPITSDPIFSNAIREALQLAGGVKI